MAQLSSDIFITAAPVPECWNKGAMGSFRGAHGQRVEHDHYNGGLGAEPPEGSRGRAPFQGARGRSFPEAESFLALGRATGRANLYPLQYFQQSITIR